MQMHLCTFKFNPTRIGLSLMMRTMHFILTDIYKQLKIEHWFNIYLTISLDLLSLPLKVLSLEYYHQWLS